MSTFTNTSKNAAATFSNTAQTQGSTYFEFLIDSTYSFLIDSQYKFLIGDSATTAISWSNTSKS